MKILNGNPSNRTKIQADFLYDNRLSFEAKGLLSYLLANKSDDFNAVDLVNASKNRRDSTRRIIRELIRLGYIQREQLKNSEGKFYGVKHYIYPNGRNANN
jgi:predicted transcriptional regulator